MSMSNSAETNLGKLLLQNVTWANVGDATGLVGSAVAGSWYCGLATAFPGEGGTQATSQAAYTGYARVAVARSTGGWAMANNIGDNVGAITFPVCTGAPETEFWWTLGRDSGTGAGELFAFGPLIQSGADYFVFVAATSDTLTVPGNPFAVNDEICFLAMAGGSALPTGITEGTRYFVKTSSGNDITISTTQGGSTLDITAAGAGFCIKMTHLAVDVNITPSFAAGVLDLVFA